MHHEHATPDGSHVSFSGKELVHQLTTSKRDSAQEIEGQIKADPLITEVRQLIREARAAKNPAREAELVARNRELTKNLKSSLLRQAGLLPAEPSHEDQERIRLERLGQVRSKLRGNETDSEVLGVFGLIDPEGKASIESPLFKEQTKQAFDTYIESVRRYSAAVEIAGTSLKNQNQNQANITRTQMHDRVASAIASDLGLPFDSARSFAAKARDERIPGSGESRLYARRISRIMENYGDNLGLVMQHDQQVMENILDGSQNSSR